MQQTIRLLVQDQPGALMRVTGIVTSKGANIRTLTVTPDPDQPGFSRIVIGIETEPRLRDRVVNEMNRLVQVLHATDISDISDISDSSGQAPDARPATL